MEGGMEGDREGGMEGDREGRRASAPSVVGLWETNCCE